MPYIKQERRDPYIELIEKLIDELHGQSGDIKGDLNYIVSRIVAGAIHPGGPASWKYSEIADAVSTFECAKLEFYRRIAGPKEDAAEIQNGDIPEYSW